MLALRRSQQMGKVAHTRNELHGVRLALLETRASRFVGHLGRDWVLKKKMKNRRSGICLRQVCFYLCVLTQCVSGVLKWVSYSSDSMAFKQQIWFLAGGGSCQTQRSLCV